MSDVEYEKCSNCNGSGLQTNTYVGEPDECHECKGDTVVPKEITPHEANERYEHIDWEGGFWECINSDGINTIIQNTPYDTPYVRGVLENAINLASEIMEYLSDRSQEDDEESSDD